MLKQLTSNTENLLKAGVFGLFALLPVIFTSATVESFEFPKTMFLYICATTLFMWLFVLKNDGKTKPTAPILVFVAIYAFSSLLSTHFYTSLWGYYSRFNGGFYSMLCFSFVYFVVINLFTKQDMNVLKRLVVVCSLPVSIYAIGQHLSLNVGVPIQELTRVYSTIGQPNWLGAYLAAICMIAFGYISFEKSKRNWLFYSFVFFVTFTALWFTFSISSLLGLAVGLAYWVLGVKGLNYKRSLLVGIACFVVMILQPGIWAQRVQDAFKSIGLVHQVAAQNTSSQNFALSDSGVIRKGIWKGTFQIVMQSPKNLIIGTGPETFPYEFQKVRPQELNYSSEWDFILNKPHNYYLEILSNTGVLGFIAYMWLIAWIFIRAEKTMRPFYLVIFVTNFFSWPITVINLLFWGFAAENQIMGTKKESSENNAN
jgi:O-antigen ligase